MDLRKLSKIKDSQKISDRTDDKELFLSLMMRVGDEPQRYINQIAKLSEGNRPERARTFYKLALKKGLDETTRRIKQEFPYIYASGEQIAKDRRASGDPDIAYLEGKGFNVTKITEWGAIVVNNFYKVLPKNLRPVEVYDPSVEDWWDENIGSNWGFQPLDTLAGNTWFLEKYDSI